MKVHVEEISKIEKKVVVELSADVVDEALAAQFKRYGKTARVKGFRPGKVPASLVKQMFRREAQSAATGELIQNSLFDAMKEVDIEPLNMPDIDRDDLVEGEGFTYSAVCQVRPEFDVQGLDTISVARNDLAVSDEDMDKELQMLREQHAELEPVEDRGADTGDILTVDFVGVLSGETEPFEGGSGNDQTIEIGSGRLVPGFEDQLMGAKEGETVEVNINFPEDYVETLASKEAVFTCTIKAVKHKVLADLDDEFARDLEHDDLGALRADIYDRQYKQLCGEEDARVRKEILDSLMEANDIDVPEAMETSAQNQLQQELHARLQMSGLGQDEVHHLIEEQMESIQTRAKDLAKRDLIIGAIAKKEELTVSDEDTDTKLQEISDATGKPLAWVKATLMREQRLEGLKIELLQDKVFEWLENTLTTGGVSAASEPASEPSTTEDTE